MEGPANELWEIEANLDRLVIPREYITIGGDLVVASLLAQIVYWHRPHKGKSKLRVFRDGNHWVAKRREDWMQECCITENEYRRAIAVLQRKGLVEVRVMRFLGVTQNHTRLLHDNLLKALRGIHAASNPLTPSGGIHASASGGIHTMIETATTSSTTTSTTDSAAPAASANGQCLEFPSTSSAGKGSSKNVKALEIIQGMKDKKLEQATNAPQLAQRWRANVSLLYPDQYQSPLTAKDLGQLKKFKADAGGNALGTLDYVLNHWQQFAHEVKLSGGVEVVAMRPSISFLLKHRDIAVTLFLQSIAPPTPAKAGGMLAAQPVAVPAPVAESEAVHQEAPENVLATLEKLKHLAGKAS